MDKHKTRDLQQREGILIGIVGPCGAGKTTLVTGLKTYGYQARGIAQEHSFAPSMWHRITNPDILIYLDVSYENTILRRHLNWTSNEYADQLHRLRHAREHANFYLDTNPLSVAEVLKCTLDFLKTNNIRSNSL